jgi:hypothetical protein
MYCIALYCVVLNCIASLVMPCHLMHARMLADALDFIKASDINQDGELNFAEMALSVSNIVTGCAFMLCFVLCSLVASLCYITRSFATMVTNFTSSFCCVVVCDDVVFVKEVRRSFTALQHQLLLADIFSLLVVCCTD